VNCCKQLPDYTDFSSVVNFKRSIDSIIDVTALSA